MSALLKIKATAFFVVAQDAETYQSTECLGSTLVEAWKALMFCPVDLADGELVEEFRAFADDEDNWLGAEGLCVLEWEVGGESAGTITFFRK